MAIEGLGEGRKRDECARPKRDRADQLRFIGRCGPALAVAEAGH